MALQRVRSPVRLLITDVVTSRHKRAAVGAVVPLARCRDRIYCAVAGDGVTAATRVDPPALPARVPSNWGRPTV